MHKHQMSRECCPELRKARRLCVYAMVGALVLLALSTKIPWLWAFGNSPAGWICAGVVAAILALVALRAIIISR
jgi:hypothetical protein